MKINLIESGIRNIKELAKQYNKAIIYGHMDLDGICSSLCAKAYLEKYGIKTIDFQIIQYGAMEWAISKPENDNVMAVLVDFAHGKPFMKIHTDHHQSQQIVKGSSNQFKHSESNADTWSTIISTNDIFPQEDIKVINMIDSAQYKREGINPWDMLRATIKNDKEKSVLRNHIDMGMACGKLILAFKNKPGFFREIVMNAKPSLESMYNVIRNIIKEKIKSGEKGYINPEDIDKNSIDYYNQQESKKIPNGTIDDIENISNGESILINNIIFQCGGGQMKGVGSYDRYTAFRLYPNSKYFIMLWDSIGTMQISKNPWNDEANLNNINLGEVVLEDIFDKRVAPRLKSSKYNISLLAIKKLNEIKFDEETKSIGFNYDSLISLYPNITQYMTEKQKYLIEKYMNWHPKDFIEQDEKEVKRALDMLGRFYIPLPEIIKLSSGGHPSITNISGFNYLNEQIKIKRKLENGENPYIKKEKTEEPKDNNEIKDKKDNLSTKILKSIAVDVIKYLSGEELGEPKKYFKKEIKKESISNERKANREAIRYIRTLDKTILENLNENLEEDFYISLSNKYDNYDYKRQTYSKKQLFNSLYESLKNNNISDSLKTYIKNILI